MVLNSRETVGRSRKLSSLHTFDAGSRNQRVGLMSLTPSFFEQYHGSKLWALEIQLSQKYVFYSQLLIYHKFGPTYITTNGS